MTTATRSRLAPQARRDQLLDLGAQLLGSRSLDELSIDLLAEEAGVSRGLLYHYFGGKQEFHLAVVRRAADALIDQTAPSSAGDPLDRLRASVAAYVDYVVSNFAGYVSLIKGAEGGNEALRDIYEEVRTTLSDRIFDSDPLAELVTDTPRHRLLVRGWAALAEETVIAWGRDPGPVTRADLVDLVTDALPALVSPDA